MSVQRYQLDVDATPFVSMALDFSSSIIEDKLQESLTPVLTGCSRIVRKLRHHRHLNSASSNAIANVIVDASGAEGVECLDDSNPACHRVRVKLDLVVKAESVKVVNMIGELSVFFGSGFLVEKLELAGTYQSIVARNLGPIDQTDSPSSSVGGVLPTIPSISPSVAASSLLVTPMPSNIQPVEHSSEPTQLPTFAPVVGATPNPSSVPSPPPTISPTPGPSPPPTPGPTSPPTVAPVEPILDLPTPEPTIPPTPEPTLPPTPGPTLPPTPNPTPQPTAPPTPEPTLPPTPQPTPGPTPSPIPCFQTNTELSDSVTDWFVSSASKASVEAEYGPIGDWCFGEGVTNMTELFSGRNFNEAIGKWDVSSVTDMSKMFLLSTSFNQDLSEWDVSSVTNMDGMFGALNLFNQDLSSWDVSSVTNMNLMFGGTSSFDQDLSRWNVASVTNMQLMFYEAFSFNHDLSSWKVSSVTNMAYMFYGTTAFNQDLSEWDVSSVNNMYKMFEGASSFNRDISSWDVSSVANMELMFFSASSFNQNLCPWGSRLPPNANVTSSFSGTNCPEQSNPNLSLLKPGPFCRDCT
ncbi:MAG: hypothetical protein SGBAC_008736 [Bacillariaceae sp.]